MDHIALIVKALPNDLLIQFINEVNESKITGLVSETLNDLTTSVKYSFNLQGPVSEYHKLVSDALFLEIANRWIAKK